MVVRLEPGVELFPRWPLQRRRAVVRRLDQQPADRTRLRWAAPLRTRSHESRSHDSRSDESRSIRQIPVAFDLHVNKPEQSRP